MAGWKKVAFSDDVIAIPAGSAQGDVLFYNGSTWTRLAAGTSGYFLKTQGAAADPVWADVTLTALDVYVKPDAAGAAGYLDSMVDDVTVEVDGTSHDLQVKAGGIDTAQLAADCIDGTKIGDDVIDSEHYVAGSIDTEHLAADCVDATKIGDDVIDSEHYVAGSIDTEHLSADCVDGTKIGDDVIDSEHYVAGSIDAEHLANDSVESAKIATDAVGTDALDMTAAFTFSGAITSSNTPSSANHVANKAYVDSVAEGLDPKEAVRAATTEALTLASDFENGDTIDGVTLATGDRILIKDQSSGTENGIYIVAASGAPARASDLAASDSAAGVHCFVTEGTDNGDRGFLCSTDAPNDVVGTDSLTFVEFTALGQITAGDGLVKSGDTININDDDTTLTIASDVLKVKDGGIDTTQLASGAATVAKMDIDANLECNQKELQNIVMHKAASIGSPVEGQYFYDTDDDSMYIYTGA